MSGLDATLLVETRTATTRRTLAEFLDAGAAERAAVRANTWIKSLRHARVDGVAFRERFTYRDDSLWWFAELYLHKEGSVAALCRTIGAAAALLEREAPTTLRLEAGDERARLVIPQLAQRAGCRYEGPAPRGVPAHLLRMEARSTALMLAAAASPLRPRRIPSERADVVSFIHRAFWRSGLEDATAETYVGPVLKALERRLHADQIRHVSVGPAVNFRARRWWRPARQPARAVRPIERLVPRSALAGSSGVWAARHAMRRAMRASGDLRSAAVIEGCDCWPILARSLDGVALLQFPWSARAMDEAGAALDALEPAVALTYAEAGGWGRALALEARRRAVPLAGLQHGFIYRHWLNYLHEADEMRPLPPPSQDAGFPRPALTLLFDGYARQHLIERGRFPPDALIVTGSPRLDELGATVRNLDEGAVERARQAAGAGPGTPLLLLVTKYTEARAALPALLEAVAALPEARLAIKAHPAETVEGYERAAAGVPNARVLDASAPLAPLLRAARAVVTVNSTVALDAMALGVPALTIGLPNNLSPFVDAGALAGAASEAEIAPALRRLLYDEEFRSQLAASAAATAAAHGMAAGGGSAERQADAVLGLRRRKA